ncbi:SDR family NAD(P)-dependent oxidoreductase [Nonomuraea dietziae]|uniref:3-oxoacyl-[acyl-carrier protein] reductase n=1 Tax=Nonomuraea dietziae TaxID=65515 RepID=A0A7W5V5U2_9ACTN|nr:SDR family oxidoreductase [Nonomuraea dietziae]MBB3728441.1 3-oxoacyl-[acyl-carrier protein] reductase [Nonomuraea dietziae]
MREVVVTGGGTGIGFAIAAAFAGQGDKVTITGRREQVLREAADKLGASYAVFDAASPVAVQEALAHLPATVDVLVNNAGGNTNLDRQKIENDLMDLAEAWWANLNANLMSAVLVTTALLPRLSKGGRIVSIGSIAARGTGSGSYGAAKAAMESWTADLAAELGSKATANVVAPGLVVDTEFFRGRLTPEGVRHRVESTRNGRAGTPDDIAETVVFLASPGAGHLTGQVLHVNGGAYLGR